MLAILGGSGLTALPELKMTRREIVRTPFGEPSGPLLFGMLGDASVVFLPRHGYGHTIPPHDINYRANIWALKNVEAQGVVAVASVGGIRNDLVPGSIVLLDQLIDYTWGRDATYFDSTDMPVTHIDFTLPFDTALMQRVRNAAHRAKATLVDGGCYACTQGPRLETAAEINRLERDGADVVGMTLMPEAALARELDLPYAALAVVVNQAAGRGASEHAISMEQIGATLDATMCRVRDLLVHAVADAAVAAQSI